MSILFKARIRPAYKCDLLELKVNLWLITLQSDIAGRPTGFSGRDALRDSVAAFKLLKKKRTTFTVSRILAKRAPASVFKIDVVDPISHSLMA